MSIYQEEMTRKLPKLGCTGTLSIRQNGVFLCQQLIDGALLYTDDKVTSQNFGVTCTAIGDEAYRIRECLNLYERSRMRTVP